MLNNLFNEIPSNLPSELVVTLLDSASLRIEQIVSHGHASPVGFWYNKEQHEWVILLKGAARMTVEGTVLDLKPGDFVNIPAHQKHRVDWTTPDEPTIWLAVFYDR